LWLTNWLSNIALPLSRKNEREKQAINMEVENHTRVSRDLENSLHQMELQERDLVNKMRDKDRLEEDIERIKQEMANFSSQSKVNVTVSVWSKSNPFA
jgi:hypothetical protein